MIRSLEHSIQSLKEQLGRKVLILGHHYQRDEVIAHADFTGDSLRLARIAREHAHVQNIIFCGVHFMAESTNILASPNQRVSLPDLQAGCHMADMADANDVISALSDIDALGFKHVLPITYINSSASLKAIVGDRNGSVCTSSNAEKIVTWALEHGTHLFFFPDQHLGRNVCKKLGLNPESDMLLWDPKKYLGGHSEDMLRKTKVWLWAGHCPVHALFSVHQIKKIRSERPNTKIIVHPECAMEVVDLSDLSGSTDFIIKTIENAEPGSSWAIGTEKHLVERLARRHTDKEILSLNPFTCLCATMNRIRAESLENVLQILATKGTLMNEIVVPEKIAKSARVALERMFELS